MRTGKLTYFILLIGITSFIFTNIFENYLAGSFRDSNGVHKWNIVASHLNNVLDSQGRGSFTLADMHMLEEHTFKNRDIAYSAAASTSVIYNDKNEKADVYGVNYKYSKFHNLKLKVGSFLSRNNEYENTAVIDEALAEQLFGNVKVIGMHIELYSEKFRIIGVAEKGTSLLDTLTDNGHGKVYIGAPRLLELNTDSRITSLEVETTESSTIGKNTDELSAALPIIGKNPESFNITDLNIEKAVVEQKSKISIFMAGLVIIIIILIQIKKIVINLCNVMSGTLKNHYFIKAFKVSSKKLIIEAVKIMLLSAIIVIIWRGIRFSLYIPAEYIPDDLTNTTFFTDLVKSKIAASLLNEGYIRTQMEIKLAEAKSLINQSFYINLFTGLPLIYLAYYLNKITKLRRDSNVKTKFL